MPFNMRHLLQNQKTSSGNKSVLLGVTLK